MLICPASVSRLATARLTFAAKVMRFSSDLIHLGWAAAKQLSVLFRTAVLLNDFNRLSLQLFTGTSVKCDD